MSDNFDKYREKIEGYSKAIIEGYSKGINDIDASIYTKTQALIPKKDKQKWIEGYLFGASSIVAESAKEFFTDKEE